MSAKKTDIANIREIAKAFLYLEPEVNPDIIGQSPERKGVLL